MTAKSFQILEGPGEEGTWVAFWFSHYGHNLNFFSDFPKDRKIEFKGMCSLKSQEL